MWRALAVLVAAGAAMMLPRAASAQLRTCVQIDAPSNVTVLGRIVAAEIDRHPTHRAATDGCQSFLSVELVDLGPRDGQWLTGRIDAHVPHRERIGADGLVPAVERLLTVVLNNDPLLLKGPESPGWLRRQGRALERQSAMHFGIEGYELVAPLGGSLQALPGVALAVRRDVSAVYVGFRLGGAFDLSSGSDRLRLRAQVDAQIEGAVYAAPAADTSLFAAVLLGLAYQRFDGPASFDSGGSFGTATSTSLSIAVRGGVEALRTSDVRVIAYLQLQAPTSAAVDPDHGVVDQWVPSASLGAGLLF
jgi:hypothetical protein